MPRHFVGARLHATRTLTLIVQSESTANWAATDQQWRAPINALVARLSSFGTFPASYQFGFGALPGAS